MTHDGVTLNPSGSIIYPHVYFVERKYREWIANLGDLIVFNKYEAVFPDNCFLF